MSKQLQVEVVTPQRQVLNQAVDELVCPGAEGSFGVLPGHMPLVAALNPGMLKIRVGAEETIFAIGGGYAEIGPDKAVILADTAERAEDIDVEAARREKERAISQLKKGVHGAEMDGAEVSLKKALARLTVADAVRRRKSTGR
jgi:F-type H+-transporting ATPase subunit epsilon